MTNKRVLFVITEDWALITHRLHLVKDAIAKGFVVGIATRIDKHSDKLKDLNINLFQWPLERKSLNPIQEIISIVNLYKILIEFKPNIIHAVAQKPVIYAGLARKLYPSTALISTLGGLGFIFTADNFKAKILKPIVKSLLKFVLNDAKTRLILQNNDNVKTVVNLNIVKKKYIRLVKGAGVEIEKFCPTPIPSGIPLVILPARMLKDKGINC